MYIVIYVHVYEWIPVVIEWRMSLLPRATLHSDSEQLELYV